MIKDLTKNQIKKLFYYDPNDGWLYWKKTNWKAGRADYVPARNYTRIRIGVTYNGKHKGHLAHRLIWILHYDKIPKDKEIDHIDHNQLNNKIENLRIVTHAENGRNQKAHKNKTGYGNIDKCLWNNTKKYRARLAHNGKRIHLGVFTKIEDALKSLELARIKYGYHPTHCKI